MKVPTINGYQLWIAYVEVRPCHKYMTNKRGKALREYDQVLLQDMDNLEKLLGSEWSDNISYHSPRTVYKKNLTSQIFSQLLKTWRC